MNILISTTTNWNCGDDFIRIGVKNILNKLFPNPNWINYDRNPNNMIAWPHNQNMRSGLHGNFMNNPINWNMIDMVVFAGSPEFLHHPLKPIYEGLANNPHIPLLALGVGYSEPDWLVKVSQEEIDVLSRKNTLIITRQYDLSERLIHLLNREVFTFPCPALFCFEQFPEKTSDTVSWNIVHSLDELKSQGTYFSSDPYDMLNFIGCHRTVVSKRLHGAIAGISSGAYTTLINGSFRAQSAIKLFEEVMESTPEKIQQFKRITLIKYYTTIGIWNHI